MTDSDADSDEPRRRTKKSNQLPTRISMTRFGCMLSCLALLLCSLCVVCSASTSETVDVDAATQPTMENEIEVDTNRIYASSSFDAIASVDPWSDADSSRVFGFSSWPIDSQSPPASASVRWPRWHSGESGTDIERQLEAREFQLASTTTGTGSICDTNPCMNDATCELGGRADEFSCVCSIEWKGLLCNESAYACDESPPPCGSHGSCTQLTQPSEFTCACTDGYTGETCEVPPIDVCAGVTCNNGGSCNTTCSTHCSASSCLNNGTCIEQATGFTCNCPIGWSGSTCAVEVRPCDSVTCHNEGVCQSVTPATATCACADGFTGPDCSTALPYCDLHTPCVNGGVCLNTGNASAPFECACNTQVWNGPTCANSVKCGAAEPTCRNNATCASHAVFGFTCACTSDYEGDRCEQVKNSCTPSSCGNNGTCTPTIGGAFTCACAHSGWNATDNCYSALDHCAVGEAGFGACKNGGRCESSMMGFSCACDANFTGPTCEFIADKCRSLSCAHGGYCIEPIDPLHGAATCVCPTGYWTGTLCDTRPDNCANSPCQHGGTCSNQPEYGTYQCTCMEGYAQPNCSTCVAGRTAPESGCTTYIYSPPQVQSARLSDDLKWIQVTLDRPCNRLGITNGANQLACSSILSASTMSLIGPGGVCFWSSFATAGGVTKRKSRITTDTNTADDTSQSNVLIIDITLATQITATIGSNITLQAGKLVTANGLSAAQATEAYLTTLLMPPTIVPIPSPRLSAPLVVLGCDEFVLDSDGSTGSAGRPLNHTWRIIQSFDSQLTDIQLMNINAHLIASTNSTIAISSYYFPAGHSYTFSLTLTNWLGGAATINTTIAKSAYTITPTITFTNGTQYDIAYNESLFIPVHGSLSSCAGLTLLTFSSALVSTTATSLPDFAQSELNASTIRIAPLTLTPSETYVFAVTVTSAILYQSTHTTRFVSVRVAPIPAPAPIKAAIDAEAQKLSVRFDQPTDQAKMTTTTPCAAIFADSTMSHFDYLVGDRYLRWLTACRWTDSSQLELRWELPFRNRSSALPLTAQLIPPSIRAGIMISFRSGVLRSADGFSKAMPATQLPLAPPTAPYAPIARINAPARIAACETFEVDGAPSLSRDGRPVSTYSWTMVPDTALWPLDGNASSPTLRVAGNTMPAGVYTFLLNVTNSYGLTDRASWSVTIVTSPIPTLAITERTTNSTIDFSEAYTVNIHSSSACGSAGTVSLSLVLVAAFPPSATARPGGVGITFAARTGFNTLPSEIWRPAATYKLRITATDTATRQNNSLDLQLNVRSVAVPRVLSTSPSNSMKELYTVFDSSTNGTGVVACSSVWSSASLALLSARSCFWSTAARLVTRIGSGATFTIGTQLQFNAHTFKIASYNGLSELVNTMDDTIAAETDDYEAAYLASVAGPASSTAVNTSVTVGKAGLIIQPPAQPQLPEAFIAAPNTISACDPILLSAASSRGGLARPFIGVTWFIQPDPLNQLRQDEYDGINAYLNQFNDLVVTIPPGLLPAHRNYTVGVALTNWLGYRNVAYAQIFVSEYAIPVVRFNDASARTIDVNQPLIVTTQLTRSACDRTSDQITYRWETIQSPGDSPFVVPSYTSRLTDFYIKPYALLSNSAYQFRVTAIVFGQSVGSSATVLVQVRPARVIASLANQNGTINMDQLTQLPQTMFPVGTRGLIIDATPSFDIESVLRSGRSASFLPPRSDFPGGGIVTYEFGCVWKVRLTLCFDEPQPIHANQTDPRWYIPEDRLIDTRTAGPDGTPDAYIFFVRVQYGPASLRPSSYAAASIDFTHDLIPAGVGIRPLPSELQVVHSSLALRAILPTDDDYAIQWSTGVGNTFNLSDASHLLTSPTSANLVLAPFSLLPGSESEFIVTIRSRTRAWLNSTSAAIVVKMATLPGGGYCKVTPHNGTAFNQQFQVACHEWTDDDPTQPLAYEFSLIEFNSLTRAEVRRTRLTMGDGASMVSLKSMPPGLPELNYVQTIRATITNGAGGRDSFDCNVTVYPPPHEVAAQILQLHASSVIMTDISQAVARGDHAAFSSGVQLVLSVAKQFLNSTALVEINARMLTQLVELLASVGSDSRLESTTVGLESHASLVSLVCGDANTLNASIADECMRVTGQHIASIEAHTGSIDTTEEINSYILTTIGEVIRTTQYGPSCGLIPIGAVSHLDNCTLVAPTNSTQYPDPNGYPYSESWWSYLYFGERALFLSADGSAGVDLQLLLFGSGLSRLSRAAIAVRTMQSHLLSLSVASTKRHTVGQAPARAANRDGFMQIIAQKHDRNSFGGVQITNYGITAAAFTGSNTESCNGTYASANTTDTVLCNATLSSSSVDSLVPSGLVAGAYAPATQLRVTAPTGLIDLNGKNLFPLERLFAAIFATIDINLYGDATANATNTNRTQTASQVLSFSLVDITAYSSDTATIDGSTEGVNTGTGLPGDDGVPPTTPTDVNVADLAEPFIMLMPHTRRVNLIATPTACQWWDTIQHKWSTVGCSRIDYLSTSLYTACACVHLTDFRIGLGSPESLLKPSINLITITDITNLNWRNIQNHPTVFLTLLIIFGVYFMILPLVHHRDQCRLLAIWSEEAARELQRYETYLATGIIMNDTQLYQIASQRRGAEGKQQMTHGKLQQHVDQLTKTADSDKSPQPITFDVGATDVSQCDLYHGGGSVAPLPPVSTVSLPRVVVARSPGVGSSDSASSRAADLPRRKLFLRVRAPPTTSTQQWEPIQVADFITPHEFVEKEEQKNRPAEASPPVTPIAPIMSHTGLRNRGAPPPPPSTPPSIPSPPTSDQFESVMPLVPPSRMEQVRPGDKPQPTMVAAGNEVDERAMSIDAELHAYNTRPFLSRWYWRVRHNFKYQHVYVSVLYRKKNDVLTGVEKITVVLCYILGAMLVNAAFYQNKQNNVFAYISVAIISSVVIVPAKMILRLLFGISGDPFEKRRNKFRRRYRKVIAAKIARDIANERATAHGMEDRKPVLVDPTDERLRRQEEYCNLVFHGDDEAWEDAEYQDADPTFDELTDAELIDLNRIARDAENQARAENQLGRDADSPDDTASATAVGQKPDSNRTPGEPQPPIQPVSTSNSPRELDRAISARSDTTNANGTITGSTHTDNGDKPRRVATVAAALAERQRQLKQKKQFRCPACCKSALMLVAAVWCLTLSVLMLIYGIKFDLAAEAGGVAQDSDPVARSYLWLISCILSMSQDIILNEPIILCARAAAALLLGNIFAIIVKWAIRITTQ